MFSECKFLHTYKNNPKSEIQSFKLNFSSFLYCSFVRKNETIVMQFCNAKFFLKCLNSCDNKAFLLLFTIVKFLTLPFLKLNTQVQKVKLMYI